MNIVQPLFLWNEKSHNGSEGAKSKIGVFGHFGPNIYLSGPFWCHARPKTNGNEVPCWFSDMWVTKLLLPIQKFRNWAQKRPNLAQKMHFWWFWLKYWHVWSISCHSWQKNNANEVPRSSSSFFANISCHRNLPDTWLLLQLGRLPIHEHCYNREDQLVEIPKSLHLFARRPWDCSELWLEENSKHEHHRTTKGKFDCRCNQDIHSRSCLGIFFKGKRCLKHRQQWICFQRSSRVDKS